jgi:hypothetical protein
MITPIGKTNISWSANDRYLQNFANVFEIAQRTFPDCRKSHRNLPMLFDRIHEVYRMEFPYFDEAETREIEKEHDALNIDVENYRKTMQLNSLIAARNSPTLYKKLDMFFTKLTKKAVEHNFFPKGIKDRTMDDKLESLKGR